jgi:hypothetical protein
MLSQADLDPRRYYFDFKLGVFEHAIEALPKIVDFQGLEGFQENEIGIVTLDACNNVLFHMP